MNKERNSFSLLFRYAVLFIISAGLVLMAFVTAASLISENDRRARCEEDIRGIGTYLAWMLRNDPDEAAALSDMPEDLLQERYGELFGLTGNALGGGSAFIVPADDMSSASVLLGDGSHFALYDPGKPDRPKGGADPLFFEVYETTATQTSGFVTSPADGKELCVCFTRVNGDCRGVVFTFSRDFAESSRILVLWLGLAAYILILTALTIVWFLNISQIGKRIAAIDSAVKRFSDEKTADAADDLAAIPGDIPATAVLARDTAELMRSITGYIAKIEQETAEKVRIGADLNVATKIQADLLPTKFPDRPELDLYAAMTPAKEVGGDFYDFFKIDSDHIGLVMADVSGKGVPAALFMVIAKTLIQDRALMGRSPARVLEYTNNRLCENNASGFFVTAWLGVLELSSGKLTFANAGHEYPAIKRAEGAYELRTGDNCPPLAAMEDMEYDDEKLILAPGDSIFLYTDGVPEAKSADGKRFGTDKMVEILNECAELTAKELIGTLKNRVDEFSGDDPFDDVTMLCVKYFGKKK